MNFRKWVNQVLQSGKTLLGTLKELPPDKAKENIADALNIILRYRSPHR